MLVLILDMQPLCLKDQAKFIDNMMIYFPHYALGSGLKNIYSAYEYNEICDFQKNGKSQAAIATKNKHIIDKLMFTLCVRLFESIFKLDIFPIGCAIIAIDCERKHFFFFNANE